MLLYRTDQEEPLLEQVSTACSIWSRFVGLQFRKSLDQRCGILLAPCSSVHTMWMRFRIDIYFLSKCGVVEEIRRNVKPWNVVLPKTKPHSVLETSTHALQVELGTQLWLQPSNEQRVPKAIEQMTRTME